MFILKRNRDGFVLRVELPQGHTQDELIQMADKELKEIEPYLRGATSVSINGRLTAGVALLLGRRLGHICKNVWLYDPEEGFYIKAVWH